MPKLEANLQFMFNEYDLLDRYDAAARAGFKGVELQAPYSVEPDAIVERLHRNKLQHVIINLPVNDPDTGKGNIPLRPDRKDLWLERVALGVKYAGALDCVAVNTGVGPKPDDVDDETAWTTLVENQRHAADELSKVGVKAMVEAINVIDQPGFFVNTSKQARKLIEAVNHSNYGMLYDVYHMQIQEGDLARGIKANLDVIMHMQLADNPGRHEPGTGEINYDFILPYLDEVGYEGWIGCEYRPIGNTEQGLAWAKKWLSA